MTGYALGVAVGAPPLAVLTSRASPYKALSSLMLLFIIGNAMCASAPGYGWLMTGRIVTTSSMPHPDIRIGAMWILDLEAVFRGVLIRD